MLPLHGGKAPPWLFRRMVRLSRQVLLALVEDHGPAEVLRRLADPFWFQAFGCLLGFDWHSSGLTTTVCGALKEAVRGNEAHFGLFVAGGKGRTSLNTPTEIRQAGERLGRDLSPLERASRLSAKVDNTALQDGHTLYHHTMLFTPDGAWAVIQQGMNPTARTARRYHWLGERVVSFVCEPHTAVCGHPTRVLNLVAREAEDSRQAIATLSTQEPVGRVVGLARRLPELRLPHHHHVTPAQVDTARLERILSLARQLNAGDFEGLLLLRGLGPATLRALALLAELLYGTAPSFRDPATFAFAHGGKDGHPFPVDRTTYDATVEFLADALRRARLGDREKLDALRRLRSLTAPPRR